jgi:hypothetical protein
MWPSRHARSLPPHLPPHPTPPPPTHPQHLAIPAWKRASHYIHSPLVSSAPSSRDLLLFFRGDVGIHHGDGKKYSRGIRQELYRRYKKYNWEKKYRVIISYREEHKGFYSDFLKRSRFCLAPPGELRWAGPGRDQGCA